VTACSRPQITGPADGYEHDFRLHTAQSAITPVDLPDAVITALLSLMHRLGLWYGPIDLRRAPDGDYVFLEINPAGQWLFVEYATGQPICQELATLLARLDRDQRQAA
jgi:glutathione synthase/RimK-type ligase-like ATP-grasp enzyme